MLNFWVTYIDPVKRSVEYVGYGIGDLLGSFAEGLFEAVFEEKD